MAARKVSNLLGLAVLSYLVQKPQHPYELGRTLKHNDDGRSIKYNHGSLYMVFEQLHRAGFIEEVESQREGNRPERTVYALTGAGRVEQREWMRDLVEEPQHEHPRFVAALSLIAALHPDDVVELLTKRLTRLDERRTKIHHLIDDTIAKGSAPLFLIEEEYRLALLDAERSFVEGFIARITDPVDGWRDSWAAALEQFSRDQQTDRPHQTTEGPKT